MAMNVWNSRGTEPHRNTLSLSEVSITVPNVAKIGALGDRLKIAGIASRQTGAALCFEDPWTSKLRVAVGNCETAL